MGQIEFGATGSSETFSQRDAKSDLAPTEVSTNVAIEWFPHSVV